jgi:protein SCO1
MLNLTADMSSASLPASMTYRARQTPLECHDQTKITKAEQMRLNRQGSRGRQTALLAAPAVLAIALAVALGGCSGGSSPAGSSSSTGVGASTSAASSSGFDGAALPAGSAHGFTLADLTDNGRTVSLSQYRGQVVVLAFLYSTCGAPCVVIAQQIRGALGELARPVPVLLVSADPAADTPARVRSFLAQVSLTGRAQWLTGSLAELRAVWHGYGITPASAGGAAFANSASVFLLDRAGRKRVLFQSEELTPEGLAHDIRKLQSLP